MSDTYRQEDVQEILQLAIAKQAHSGELSRQQLLEIAEELGLSAFEIQRAEEEWALRRDEEKDRQTFMRYRRVQFKQHVTRFLIVNAFLVVFAFVTDWTLWMTLCVALFWGMFLTLDGWSAWQTEGDTFERRYQKWKRKRWFKRSVSQLFKRWFKAL